MPDKRILPRGALNRTGNAGLVHLVVDLDSEELAVIEGWRQANLLSSQADAARALIQLGIMSEVSRTFRSVARNGEVDDDSYDDGGGKA